MVCSLKGQWPAPYIMFIEKLLVIDFCLKILADCNLPDDQL